MGLVILGNQCRAVALKGSASGQRAFHGGKSTGPKTQAGRDRIAAAKTTHGMETRNSRTDRSLASARLTVLRFYLVVDSIAIHESTLSQPTIQACECSVVHAEAYLPHPADPMWPRT